MKQRFDLDGLLAHQLLIVSGKGGVGKTTLSLALGLIAAEKGIRTLIAEINSEEQVSQILERPPLDYQETELLPNLWGINIQPKRSFEEYVLLQIKIRTLYKAVFENKFVRRFIEATPGLADLMSIGKVFELTRRYGLVIVDAPATGHGIALLEIPSIVGSAVRVGPLKTEAEKIDGLLHDAARTRVVLATLPEEMPITEALEMTESIEEKLHLPLGPLFLNQVQPRPFTGEERKEIARFLKPRGPEDTIARILNLQIARAELSDHYGRRLAESFNRSPIVPIPFIFSARFGLPEIQAIAAHLEEIQ